MGGVDLVDQQLDQVNVLRRTYKWYKKLALRLVMQGMLNSHKDMGSCTIRSEKVSHMESKFIFHIQT